METDGTKAGVPKNNKVSALETGGRGRHELLSQLYPRRRINERPEGNWKTGQGASGEIAGVPNREKTHAPLGEGLLLARAKKDRTGVYAL